MTTIAEMPAGFANKVLSAQSTFRSVMDAMARPGSVQRIVAPSGVPAPMMAGTAAIALTLFDQDTPVWLDAPMATSDVAKWIRFHCSAPVVTDSAVAHFAVVGAPDKLQGFERFALGSGEYPDRSTTLMIQVESLTEGPAIELSGPGIDGATMLRATHGVPDLLDRLAANHARFPRGVDLILVAGDSIVALPRTTRLVAKED
jgi:alpha-D-ribose 1-methylphosphonate 5-triphosphate synthase subunit PhnH